MKAAVVGCGRMGAEPSKRLEGLIPAGWLPLSHAEAILATEGLELVALCDMDRELLAQRGDMYGVSALFTDFRELIETAKPDLITIATRTPAKCGIIEYACRNGVKGLYVEKPLANSLAECRQALSEIERAGVKIAYGVNRRYHPVYRHAKELILNGEIGQIVEVVLEHGQAQLLWAHPHSVDLVLFFLNAPELVSVQASLLPETVIQEGGLKIDSDPIIQNAFFKFETTATASIVRSGGLNTKIAGETGNIIVHADGSYIQLNRAHERQAAYFVGHEVRHSLSQTSATVTALTELREAMTSSSLSPISPREIELGIQMLMGCVWSHLVGGRCVETRDIPAQCVVTGRYKDQYA